MRYSIIFFLSIVYFGCQSPDDQVVTPKPRMYPYVHLPRPHYELVSEKADCGFTFRKSVFAQIKNRETFFDEKLKNDCWFDLQYPSLQANVHFTYYPIGKGHNFDALTNESFQLAYEHSAIATAIEEIPVIRSGHEEGMIFSLRGPVASPYQFFLTDTTNHFLRGALYFKVRPNPDSIAPVLEYIRTDMDTLIKTLHWQNTP